MSCLEGKDHEFVYSIMNRCYECKQCKSQKQLIEEPEKFEEIANSIIQYCKEMVVMCDVGDAVIPIIRWTMNLVYLWKMEKLEKKT